MTIKQIMMSNNEFDKLYEDYKKNKKNKLSIFLD